METTRGNRYSLNGRGFISTYETMFYIENNQSLEQLPQGRGGVPIAGGLQDAIRQGAR